MSECEMGVWWIFCYVTVNSFIENVAPFTDSNKNCEGMQRVIFDTLSGERYPTCNGVTNNSIVINKIVMQ